MLETAWLSVFEKETAILGRADGMPLFAVEQTVLSKAVCFYIFAAGMVGEDR
jgi:hypothetical protein